MSFKILGQVDSCEFTINIRRGEKSFLVGSNKNKFLKLLKYIIDQRINSNITFFDIKKCKKISSKKYYSRILLELHIIANKMFEDSDFYHEQLDRYENYYDYINDIIDDIIKENTNYIVKTRKR